MTDRSARDLHLPEGTRREPRHCAPTAREFLLALLALVFVATASPPSAFAGAASECGDGLIEGPEQCDDGNTTPGDGCAAACLVEACFECSGEPSACAPAPNGTLCDDLDVCTETDVCVSGVCQGGAPLSCPDPGACAVPVCDPISGCGSQLEPNGTPCDDGNPDTDPDTCQAGTCQGVPLTSCVGRPDGSPCDDNNVCTTGDSCFSNSCKPGTPVSCTALDQCHLQGICNPFTGCNNPVRPDGSPCDDTDLCTQLDSCQSGVCTGGDPVVCTAQGPCLDPGTCDPNTGVCSSPAKPDGTACDDSDLCTQLDVCLAGTCTGTDPLVCVAPSTCAAAGSCDAATGLCSHPPLPSGTACEDGNACTSGDVCDGAGVCLVGTSSCGDGNLSLQCDEQCDDGNMLDGDGCSSACAVETSIVQSLDQERCINEAVRRGLRVASVQGRQASDCVRFAGLGKVERLADAGEEQTASACLENDVKAKVQRAVDQLSTGVANRCTAPEQIPDFAFSSASVLSAAAREEAIGLIEDVFGADLSGAIVSSATDKNGARCQSELTKRSRILYDELWKLTRKRARDALRCSRPNAPSSCASKGIVPLPVGTGFELQLAALGYVDADPKAKIFKRTNQIGEQAIKFCAPASTSIVDLAPGFCSASADAAALATCVSQQTRCRFCRNFAIGHVVLASCDVFDDGLANESCNLEP